MKVKCLTNTTRLVKSAVYEVHRLRNLNTNNSKFFRPSITVIIRDGTFVSMSLKNFIMEDGTNIPTINWQSDQIDQDTRLFHETKISDDNISKGEYVVYTRNDLESFIKGKIYQIKEIRKTPIKTWNGSRAFVTKIQIDGSSRWFKTWGFRKCSTQEIRDLNLKSLFDEKVEIEKIDKKSRKIDKLLPEEKKTLILKVLLTAAIDKNRNTLSILDWALQKTGKNWKLTIEDFNPYLSLKLEDLFKELE